VLAGLTPQACRALRSLPALHLHLYTQLQHCARSSRKWLPKWPGTHSVFM